MKYKKLKVFAPIAFIWLLAIAGSASGQQSKTSNTLSDPEIAFVTVTVTQIDIDYANIALKRSKNVDVVNFAETMVSDHQAIIRQASELLKKLGISPTVYSVSAKMISDAENIRKHLNSISDQEFDKAYISNETRYHKSVIDAIENLLIPESENAQLKNLLVSVLPALKEHHAFAELLQSKMK